MYVQECKILRLSIGISIYCKTKGKIEKKVKATLIFFNEGTITAAAYFLEKGIRYSTNFHLLIFVYLP